jgi:protein translocase SecG subunit
MLKILHIVQLVSAVCLMVTILLQNRGAGLSGAFGGDFGGYYTRRGFERFLVYFSVILAIIFVAISIANLVLGTNPAATN